MRVCYNTAQRAHQAVLEPAEQTVLHLLACNDAAALAQHRVLCEASSARTTRLVEVCLQNNALRCAWVLLQRARPGNEAQVGRARKDAMRLSACAMQQCTRATTCAQKQRWATLATLASNYAASRGFAPASVQVMETAAEAFFLTAFNTPRVLYANTRSVRQSPSVQLWMSLALLRFADAQHFETHQALTLLHALLGAFAHDERLRPLVCEDVRALLMPLHHIVHRPAHTDAACLVLVQKCVAHARVGLNASETDFQCLAAQVQARLAAQEGARAPCRGQRPPSHRAPCAASACRYGALSAQESAVFARGLPQTLTAAWPAAAGMGSPASPARHDVAPRPGSGPAPGRSCVVMQICLPQR